MESFKPLYMSATICSLLILFIVYCPLIAIYCLLFIVYPYNLWFMIFYLELTAYYSLSRSIIYFCNILFFIRNLLLIILCLISIVYYGICIVYYLLCAITMLYVGWMKDIFVSSNCLSPTLVEKCDSYLDLYLARRSIKLIKDRTFLHGPSTWQ